MLPRLFVQKYLPAALDEEKRSGYPALCKLTQAAVESGWGENAVGFNFFGIKDTDGVNGNEQLVTTTEWLKTQYAKFPVIISVIWVPVRKLFKYKVKDYFRKYGTPQESFKDHTEFILKNKRYSEAWKYRDKPFLFLTMIAKAGYATSPDYQKLLIQVYRMIEKESKK